VLVLTILTNNLVILRHEQNARSGMEQRKPPPVVAAVCSNLHAGNQRAFSVLTVGC